MYSGQYTSVSGELIETLGTLKLNPGDDIILGTTDNNSAKLLWESTWNTSNNQMYITADNVANGMVINSETDKEGYLYFGEEDDRLTAIYGYCYGDKILFRSYTAEDQYQTIELDSDVNEINVEIRDETDNYQYTFANNGFYPDSSATTHLGTSIDEWDNAWIAYLRLLERSSDPSEPAEGKAVIWMSDGTGKGDDGDIMIASKAGGTTKYTTLFDHSAGDAW